MDEEKIKKFMKNLNLTREEAIQLIEDDENDVTEELTEEQKKVAKKMAQGDRKKETKKREYTRTPDEDKRGLIRYLADKLTEAEATEISITNVEREIEFKLNEIKYRLTLAKPRKEK